MFYYFEMCAEVAKSKVDNRSYLLAALGIRNDQKTVFALNGPANTKMPLAHAECRLARKLDYGSTVWVARVRISDGQFGMAKPCNNCMKVLKSRKVKRVYWTTSIPNEYGYADLV